MLSNRYDNLELIGEGVSAKVYKALDTHTGSAVAVKVLNPYLHTDEISLERFTREVQITRYLGHPQIVSIYDLVRDGDQTYLVMEYITGDNLKDYIKLHAPIDVGAVLAIVTQVLQVLSLCHAKNVIHRDLKPQNLIINGDGLVKLLDFGISRMTALSDLTQTGTSLGSPEYMAPELFAANVYDPRTDLYALGIITFELLTGELPFKGDSLAVLFNQHRSAPLPALARYRTDLPEWLQHFTERLLAKHSHERYQTADEALADVSERRVVSRQLPHLDQRECLNCSAPTIAELPLCTTCGYSTAERWQHGSYDVLCSEETDQTALQHYFETVLRVPSLKLGTGNTLLIRGIDRLSAEVVRKSALSHDLLLTVRQRSPFTLLTQVVAFIGLAYFTWVAATHVVWLWLLKDTAQDTSARLVEGYFYNLHFGTLALQACLILVFFVTLRRLGVQPALRDLKALQQHVATEYDWIKEVIPSTAAERDPPTQQFLAQLIEKYVLIVKRGPGVEASIRQALQDVLRTAARVAHVAAEIDHALKAPALVRQTAAYTALSEQAESETDPHRKAQLRQRRDAFAARLQDSYGLEDKYAALMNKLIRLHYVFNTLLGKALVSRLPLDAADAQLLADCLHSLRDDVKIRREVEAELAKVA